MECPQGDGGRTPAPTHPNHRPHIWQGLLFDGHTHTALLQQLEAALALYANPAAYGE